jgi:flagellar hook-length control protein FliK
MPEEKVAGARVSGLAGVTGPVVDAGVEEHDTGSYVPTQKLTDKALPSILSQEAGRQETGKQTDSRSTATDQRAEVRLQPQSESVTRAAGPSRTATAADPAISAAELENIAVGRGRLRTTFDGGAREVSAGSSLSAMARDTQVSLQAPTGARDVKAPAFVFEVAERISTVVAGGRGEITIQLKPDEFGRMNIVAESGASGILARITTESASLKQYLESNLPVLQQALQDQGLKVERIDVLVQEDLSQQQLANQWQHNFGHAPGGNDSDRTPRFAPVGADQPGAPADEITLDAGILGALHPNSTFHTIA